MGGDVADGRSHQYYADPSNRVLVASGRCVRHASWEELPERLRFLETHRVALWDVPPSAERVSCAHQSEPGSWSEPTHSNGARSSPDDRSDVLQTGCRRPDEPGPDPRHDHSVSTARIIVTLTEPDYAGSYVVVERRQDGSLVLEPESVDAVIDQFADRVLTAAEQDEMFRRLDAAAAR
jgi:hypothetical protein